MREMQCLLSSVCVCVRNIFKEQLLIELAFPRSENPHLRLHLLHDIDPKQSGVKYNYETKQSGS